MRNPLKFYSVLLLLADVDGAMRANVRVKGTTNPPGFSVKSETLVKLAAVNVTQFQEVDFQICKCGSSC